MRFFTIVSVCLVVSLSGCQALENFLAPPDLTPDQQATRMFNVGKTSTILGLSTIKSEETRQKVSEAIIKNILRVSNIIAQASQGGVLTAGDVAGIFDTDVLPVEWQSVLDLAFSELLIRIDTSVASRLLDRDELVLVMAFAQGVTEGASQILHDLLLPKAIAEYRSGLPN